MKILHTSDLHIGSRLNTRLSPQKASIRRRELLTAFDELIKKARLHSASVMIIAGDLFDEKKALASAKSRIRDAVEAHSDITFLYLPGNHEGDALSNYPMPKNFIRIGGDGWVKHEISGVGFYARERNYTTMFDELHTDSDKNIAILHGELKPSGKGEMVICEADARGHGLDYIALGHYHTYSEKKIDDRCCAVYCGSPEGRGFDEAGNLGYVIIDTDGKRVTHSFHEGAIRRLFDITADIGECVGINETEKKIRASLSEARADDLVRVTLIGHRDMDNRPDTHALYDRLLGDFWYFEIEDKTKIKINPEEIRYTKTLKGEFVSLVMEDKGLTEDEKTEIINFGICALMGEDAED